MSVELKNKIEKKKEKEEEKKMKKRKIVLCGLIAVAGLSLASCKKDKKKAPSVEDEVYDTDGGRLDIHINYQGNSGVT